MKSDKNKLLEEFSELKKIIDANPFACAIIDKDLHIKHMNKEMYDFLDYSENEIKRTELFTQLLTEDEAVSFSEFINLSPPAEEGNPWNVFKFKGRKGDCNLLLISKMKNRNHLVPYPYDVLIGIPMRDIHLESDLDNLKNQTDNDGVFSNRYESIFNNAVIGIIIFNNDHCIEEINQTFADLFGISRQDAIGNKIDNILSDPINEKSHNLIRIINKDRDRLVKDVVTYSKDLNEHNILEISLSKFQDPYDSQEKNMMIVEDITKEKDTHQALIQSEKLALTGRFAASLAHEINNPLQASIGCLGLVEEILKEEDRKAELGIYINMALDELKRGARIVKRLRDLNRKSDSSEKVPVDIKKMIDDVLILGKNRLYDKNIVSIFPYQGKSPFVMAAKDQIQSVILNLVINAIDAMPNGGYIYFDINFTDEPRGITVKIRDTGIGMNQNVIDNLFDPFFTTKEEGLGLGLYLCNEIIENHGGHIKVDSEVGKGTIFTIWLPKDVHLEEEELIK